MRFQRIKSAVKLALISMLLLVLVPSCTEMRGNPALQEEFLAALQTIDPEEPYDFTRQSTYDGWGYFHVEDRNSIYRIRAGMDAPEFVLEDCSGQVQILGDCLYFSRADTMICHDLRSGAEESLNDAFFRETATVFGDYMIVSDYGPLKIQDLRKGRDIPLVLGGDQVRSLLWCNGSLLYYTTWSDEFAYRLMKWDFVNDPLPVNVPGFYSSPDQGGDQFYNICTHMGSTLYLECHNGTTLAAMALPDETVTRLDADPAYVQHSDPLVYAEATARNDFTISEKSPQEKMLDPSILPIELFTGAPYDCDSLLYLDNQLAVCQWLEYHPYVGSDRCHGKPCLNADCEDQSFSQHSYRRTTIVRLSDGHIIWRSDGDHYTMDD